MDVDSADDELIVLTDRRTLLYTRAYASFESSPRMTIGCRRVDRNSKALNVRSDQQSGRQQAGNQSDYMLVPDYAHMVV